LDLIAHADGTGAASIGIKIFVDIKDEIRERSIKVDD
jgi:hypothetical protein